MAKKILVLEDEEELGRSIKKFLEQHNYQVTFISDIAGVESIAVEAPDLILTDLLMPRVHGFDICRAVKEDPQLKDIPLIAMTAVYKESFHKTEAMRIGVDDFLEKPFKFKTLLERVERFLGPTEEPVSTEEPGENKTMVADTEVAPKQEAKPEAKVSEVKEDVKEEKTRPHQLPEEEEIYQEEEVSPDDEITRVTKAMDQLMDLQQDYASRLPGKIIELEQIWERILSQSNTKNDLALLRRKVHNLAGSGTTFGFKQISEYARQLELQVDMIISEGEKTIAQRKNKINELLDNMRHNPLVSAEMELMRQMRGRK